MRIETVVELGGKTATGLPLPDDAVEALGGGRRPKVAVTVGGHTYRTTVGVMGGRCLVPLSAEHRTAAGVTAGDRVTIDVVLDDAHREVEVPDDLAAALEAAGARPAYDALSPSARKEHTRAVTEAKRPETRARRVEAVVARLTDG